MTEVSENFIEFGESTVSVTQEEMMDETARIKVNLHNEFILRNIAASL
jgi:hypothetical protein